MRPSPSKRAEPACLHLRRSLQNVKLSLTRAIPRNFRYAKAG